MNKTSIIKIGNSEGLILAKELLSKMKVGKGDDVYITETPNGFEISPYDPDFARTMEVAEQVMRDHRDVLKKLAD